MVSLDFTSVSPEKQLNTLSIAEQTTLAENERIIERGLKTFYEVGVALIDIRDGKLYRKDYRTFEEYCEKRWLMKQSRVYQFIDASKVINTLKSSTNGGILTFPTNERQARVLAKFDKDLQPAIWRIAVAQSEATETDISAGLIERTGQVILEAATTGHVDIGNGESTALTAALSITEREALARQQEYISNKLNRKKEKREEKAVAKATIPADLPILNHRYALHVGDLSVVIPTLTAGSIDAIITDPPYPKEFLPVYAELAKQALHVLKPGGSLLVMVGQSYLPEILAMMSPIINYNWMLTYLTPGGQAVQLWDRHVNTFWKPILWFTNGKYEGDWVGDVLKSNTNDNDKNYHHWGQSESGMADIIERFTYPGQTILDPFVGGGTTAAVALKMNRLFVGIDIEQAAIDTTQARIAADLGGAE